MDNNFAGMNGFIWWVGVVENTFDPLKMGRLRVRIIGWHNEDNNELKSEHLPWADSITPLTHTNSSFDIKEGDWVIGFFTDGNNAQKPVVFGHLNGIKSSEFNTNQGFSPQLTDTQKSLLPIPSPGIVTDALDEPVNPSRLSRGVLNGTTVQKANENLDSADDWKEPISQANSATPPQYPFNHATVTDFGHSIELDDTKGRERVRIQHGIGTFTEIHSDGSKVNKIVGDNYEIVAKDNNVLIKGTCNITVLGDVKTTVSGNYSLNVTGDIVINGQTINLNNGTMGAARIGDTADTGDDGTGSHFDVNSPGTNIIETGSDTVFIGD
jgi:hypothetical protein